MLSSLAMKNFKTYQFILLFTPFVFSFAFGLDIYIPVIPEMTKIFSTSNEMIQLTLSLFLFITGIGQLVIGPLSDQFGRKAVLFASAFLFAIGGLGCALSGDIFWLIAARAVSAFGACGMLVTSFAVVRDLFSGEKSAKMFSFLNGATGVSPTFAPILGGYLFLYWGWTSIFFLLAFMGVIAFILTKYFIDETHVKEFRVKVDRRVFMRYWQIFTHRQFIKYALIAGLAEGVFFCFFSVSPFIIIDIHGVATHEFGYYFALFGFVLSLGGFAGGKIVEKVGVDSTIALGIAFIAMGGISMLLWHYGLGQSLAGFLLPMAVACMGAMFLIGASAAAALEPFGHIAGTASAAFGCVEFGLSAVAGFIIMLFPITSSVPYGVSIVVIALLIVLLFLVVKAKSAEKAC
ncbi:MAG: multidrug effflux MFS transporter [Chlamydiales bacterium]|nr:multidrug effflux MFS transporter [Chlamydiales bacterium]